MLFRGWCSDLVYAQTPAIRGLSLLPEEKLGSRSKEPMISREEKNQGPHKNKHINKQKSFCPLSPLCTCITSQESQTTLGHYVKCF